ncbi:MAG: tyrosine-type recombinase/integrase [Bacteroidetes bacterium]|nr:tyrosine-type recombinase/integrase [Bacteroidota bacterium]
MNIEYQRLVSAYREWLRLLNFEPSTIQYSPIKLQEFLEWLERQQCMRVDMITGAHVKEYFEHLAHRKNERTGQGLSLNYLRTYRTTLIKFTRYLRETGQYFFEVPVQLKGPVMNVKSILTEAEIKRLYAIISNDAYGLRDRAMLSVYYGCGLRKQEGVHLEVKDILLERNMLYVRKGKGYKERYVPMAAKVRSDIENYLSYGRAGLLGNKKDNGAFFIGRTGKAMIGNALYERLQTLRRDAQINKSIGLHTLRHSIATHLLQHGMKLEQIGKFLGHSSLESTQIYTHIIHEKI